MKTCFICQKPIRLTGVYKDNVCYIGQGKYRHKSKCCPLSQNYKLFAVTKKEREEIDRQEKEFKFDERREMTEYKKHIKV